MKKKFTVHYEASTLTDSLEEALQKAKEMSKVQLDARPGDIFDETARITAVFE